jgi:hypothetical protein
MAYEIPGFSWTLPAAADFTGSQFRFVDVNSSAKAANPTANARAIAVRQNRCNTDQAATLVTDGISIVEAGGAITAGADVSTDATGRATASAATNRVLGVALEQATGAGIKIAVLLLPRGSVA